jgi:hypothetical protein
MWRPLLEERVVNGFWDPLYYYKDQAAMFYTTFDLSGMYKE